MSVVLFRFVRGSTVVLNIEGQKLDSIIDLSCFHPLKPDMCRSEIKLRIGEPKRVHVTDMQYDENGNVEYQEIRWVFPRTDGVLAYYVEEYDTPGGSVEYVPQNMIVDDLFKMSVPIGLGKHFIEVRNQGRCLIQVCLKDEKAIEKINWYWQE